MHLDFAIIHRETHHRDQVSGNEETKLTLVGDVKGKVVFLCDDILDGTYTLISLIDSRNGFVDAAEHLKLCDAKKVVIVATHGILSGDSAHGMNIY